MSKYELQAQKFAKAIDIAIAIISNSKEFDEKARQLHISGGLQMKQMALFPEPLFKKLSSLQYLEKAFFTFWNESQGEAVTDFWKKITEAELGYSKINILDEVLRRKKIKNRHEYDFIIDTILIAEQEGRITSEQVIQLKEYLALFEAKKERKS